MALPYHLYVISTQVPGMPIKIQYGTALVLLTFVLVHEFTGHGGSFPCPRKTAMVTHGRL